MSFWRRLFGLEKKAPGLGSGGNRSPRIRLLLADGARLETNDGAYPLLNISDTGLGFYCEGEPPRGALQGVLYLGEISLPVELEIVRQTGTLVGARIAENSSVLRATLRQLFLEEIRATEMSEVPSGEALSEEGFPRWFFAAGNYELFFIEKDGAAVRLEMEWSGRVLTAGRGAKPRIGHLPGDARGKGAKTAHVEWDAGLNDEDRAKAIRILENVPGLDPARRGELVEMIRSQSRN